MKSFGQRVWACAVITVLAIALTPIGNLRAQENPNPASTSAPHGQAKPAQPSPRHEGEQQLEQGGEADAIRNAPAVKWIAKHTGLTKNQAYWVCIGLNFAIIFLAIAGLCARCCPAISRDGHRP